MQLRKTLHSRQRGVTLIELMVGMVIGLLVIVIVGTVFINILRSSNDTLSSIKLNQEVRGLLGFMASDIRRAGYWENAAPASVDPTIAFDNPLTNRDAAAGTVTDIWIHDGGSCLMYSYDFDLDNDDLYVSDAADEYPPLFGYRLTDDGQIEATIPGELAGTVAGETDGQTNSCAPGGGGAANRNNQIDFESMTDDNVVEVTDLSFSTAGSTCINRTQNGVEWTVGAAGATTPACDDATPGFTANDGDELLEIRQIRILITARHREDNDIETTLSETVSVRNNRLTTYDAP